ncbi:hypothetical protein R5R35_010472 [Gryllus longicercus]|uniref:Uncharacterized protein n=1 Tax=Gryllus longicercus TaxID=2509291 RepID=A0AAN9ZBV9_9ORTH
MATSIRAGGNGSRDGADAVGDAFQLVAQGLVQGMVQLQEAFRLQRQEAERKIQEALRLQEERASAALREMERKLQEKDAAIRALQQRLEERLTAVEERTTASEGSGGEGGVQRLEGRVEKVEASLQRAVHKFMPRVDALLRYLEKSQSARAFPATAASACEAPATGGAVAGGGGEPLSSSSTLTPSGAGHQGAAADEEERARRRVELRVREVQLKMEEARTSPSPLGEQLCEAAAEGRLSDVRRLIVSGADVNYTNQYGSTPLLIATYNAQVDVVSLLLQRGADVNAVNHNGCSAMLLATCWDRSGRCVELLVRAGADVNARDDNGTTPLHYAARNNIKKAVRALLAAGARRDLRPWGGDFKDKTPFETTQSSN